MKKIISVVLTLTLLAGILMLLGCLLKTESFIRPLFSEIIISRSSKVPK